MAIYVLIVMYGCLLLFYMIYIVYYNVYSYSCGVWFGTSWDIMGYLGPGTLCRVLLGAILGYQDILGIFGTWDFV